jgi:NAD(P)-dependent dehydrogenase (short-subunit alcohol dehydrogenase family)
MAAAWSIDDLPDLSSKTVIVTGANSGLGFHTALHLARRGARVVLACRDAARAEQALEAITTAHPGAAVETRDLDLASLASVRGFAEKFLSAHTRLDVLCNNAGVMALPRRETADGFEMQLGTNHLGHFALTGLLLDALLATPGSRVVTTSSTMHKIGRIDFDDLHSRRSYGRWRAYGQSKLANLLFAYELQRRLTAGSHATLSVACHPGYSATNLQFAGPRMADDRLTERIATGLNRLFAQDAETGALPTVRAAAGRDVVGGEYFGPGEFFEMWGAPVVVSSSARSHDAEAAARLWSESVAQTGVRYEALDS